MPLGRPSCDGLQVTKPARIQHHWARVTWKNAIAVRVGLQGAVRAREPELCPQPTRVTSFLSVIL
jgi:hypothetical protein